MNTTFSDAAVADFKKHMKTALTQQSDPIVQQMVKHKKDTIIKNVLKKQRVLDPKQRVFPETTKFLYSQAILPWELLYSLQPIPPKTITLHELPSFVSIAVEMKMEDVHGRPCVGGQHLYTRDLRLLHIPYTPLLPVVTYFFDEVTKFINQR